ncbi:MAG TPA: biotin/lipoyl-binding protein, partial [Chloroflexota bacterium]
PASVPLSFRSSGKLSEVDVSVGQEITAGQVLARIDPTALQAAVETIITEQDDNATLVPNAAIAYAQGQGRGQAAAGANSVLVLRNGAPMRVAVQTGSSDGTSTVVLSGLNAGDRVITGGPGGQGSRPGGQG